MAAESQPTVKVDAYRAYLVIAFGITWLLWGISIALNQSRGYLMPAPGNIIALIQNGFQNSEHIILASSLLWLPMDHFLRRSMPFVPNVEQVGWRVFGGISFLSKLSAFGSFAPSSFLS